MEVERLNRMEDKLDRLDDKLDQVLVKLPTFVSWARLGTSVVAIATLTVAAIGLFG